MLTNIPIPTLVGNSSIGNTSGNTGVVSGQLVLIGNNNITLSGSTAGNGSMSISINAGGGGNVNFSAGTTSSGLESVVFSNSNNLSFGLNGSTITGSASFPAQTAFVFSNSNGVSFGTNGSTVTASVRTDYQSAGAYLTTAMLSNAATISNINISAGTTSNNLSALTFSNGNGVSFGLDGSVITATVQTNYLTTAMLSNAATISNVNISAGTTSNNLSALVFSNSNGLAFGLNGSTITGSYTVPTQTAYVFSNANGVSFGTDGSTVTATVRTDYQSAGAYLTTAMQSNAVTISNINLSAGTTSNNLSAFVLSNSNGLSFGLDGSTITGSYTVPTITNSSWTVSDNGTSGTVANLAFTNLNGVTLSLSTGAGGSHTVVASHNALTSQSNQVASAENGSYAFQTLSFSNANGLSFGTSAGSAITASVATSLTNIRVSAGTVSNNLSAITFSNSNGVSFGLNGSTITASANAFSGGMSTGGNTTGTIGMATDRLVLAGGDNITLSGSTSNGSMTITISGASAAPSPVNFSVGDSGSGSSANLGSVVFYGTNNVTFGLSDSTITASVYKGISVVAGTDGYDAYDWFFEDTNGVSWSLNSNTIQASVEPAYVFSNSNNMTFGTYSASDGTYVTGSYLPGAVNFSAGTTSNTLGSVVFSNSNGVSFGLNGSTITASVSGGGGGSVNFSAGTTSNNLTAVTFSNSNGLSFGLNGSTMTASADASSLVSGGHLSISTTGSTISLLGSLNVGMGTVGNTLGTSGYAGTNSLNVWASNGISVSRSTAAGIDHLGIVGPNPESRWVNEPGLTVAGNSANASNVSFFPLQIPFQLDMSNMRFGISNSVATTNNNSIAFQHFSWSAVLYTRDGSTLRSINSGSNTYSGTWSSNAHTQISGPRAFTLDFASTTRLERGEYWMAIHRSTTNSGTATNSTALGNSQSMLIGVTCNTVALGLDPYQQATAASRGASIGLGVVSTGNTMSTVDISQITQTGTRALAAKVWIDLRNYSLW